jgi:D-lyxose ketol-isomerase
MKRSQINKLIEEAAEFFESNKLHLPPWAKWTCDQWKDHLGEETYEIRTHGMGWNVTDFGSGDFNKQGLLLFIMRNGWLKDNKPQDTKTYAEKATGLTMPKTTSILEMLLFRSMESAEKFQPVEKSSLSPVKA